MKAQKRQRARDAVALVDLNVSGYLLMMSDYQRRGDDWLLRVAYTHIQTRKKSFFGNYRRIGKTKDTVTP